MKPHRQVLPEPTLLLHVTYAGRRCFMPATHASLKKDHISKIPLSHGLAQVLGRMLLFFSYVIWALTWENLFSGLPARSYPNHPAQLQRIESYNFTLASLGMILSKMRKTKVLIRLGMWRLVCRPVCAFVVRKPLKTGFLGWRPI